MPQVDIITGQNRHRRWTDEEKRSILAAAFAPGAVASHVAKRVNVSTGQLYTWRKRLLKDEPADSGFAKVVTVTNAHAIPSVPLLSAPLETVSTAPPRVADAIEIEVRGNKVRIPSNMPVALASAVVRALVRRR